MTRELWLRLTLESEACFSRGDGMPGVVDIEVNHDQNGLPYLGGRTLKGLLHAEAAEIMDALQRTDQELAAEWLTPANRLFGQAGSKKEKQAILHVGNAQLPAEIRQQIAASKSLYDLQRQEILETLTTIRRQTAVNPETGAPMDKTLRAVRVILRQTQFFAHLHFFRRPATEKELAFLAACVKALRHAGSNKTRGYGLLKGELFISLTEPAVTEALFNPFAEALQ